MAARPPWSRTAPAGPMYRWGYYSPGSLTTANGNNTGTLSSSVFSVRWASPNKIFQLTQLDVFYQVTTSFGSNQSLGFGLFFVRSYTASPSGGTQATFTATQNLYSGRFDTNFDKTEFNTYGDLRIASTGNLTAGTGNIDFYPLRIWPGFTGSIGGNAMNTAMGYQADEYGEMPNTQSIWVRQNEGLSVQPLATMGATGVVDFSVVMEWIEMPNQFT